LATLQLQHESASRNHHDGRTTRILSTSANVVTTTTQGTATPATLFPGWKQEVNRRVAEHLNNKTRSTNQSRTIQANRTAQGGRAAQVAARVAERYAQAPSYGEMLADEARAAVRAAEAASIAAQKAQAAVQYMLDGLEAAATAEALQQPEAMAAQAPALHESLVFDESPLYSPAVEPEQASRLAGSTRDGAENWPMTAMPEASVEVAVDFREAGAAQPIYPNLIQFPRPMVATRRMRPMRAEGPLANAPGQPQLSIFEVDPTSISTISIEPAPAVDEPAEPVWMRADLSSIGVKPQREEKLFEERAPLVPSAERIELAPLSRRIMALMVDVSLILAAFLSVALFLASHARQMPGPRTIEVCSALAVLGIAAAYQALFLTLVRVTPGMWYAGIALCTLDGCHTTRAQRCRRLTALLLSVLPLGLGMAWALFDDARLTWHDRLSKTYLRMR
jgi:uncharacterized RDD family membrane protein YckC